MTTATQLSLPGVPAGMAALRAGILTSRWGAPPFTNLDTRRGYWQDRKRQWLALGLDPGAGRGTTLLASSDLYSNFSKWQREKGSVNASDGGLTGTSLFDPVLAELLIRWFSPPAGLVLDPFAGGSIRGIVSAVLGRAYLGADISPTQVAANREQAAVICPGEPVSWVIADARHVAHWCPEQADFILSCPPYGNLERYSDDPRDLSTLAYADFRPAYTDCLAGAIARLKQDRFAALVVANFRNKGTGAYNGLVADTIAAMEAAGAAFYNDAVLLGVAGSAPIRAEGQFKASRKLVKTHQNVLVFVKGDPEAAAVACGEPGNLALTWGDDV